ncbi:MAG: ATP-binding protein [Myxococcota bacterium]
MATCVAGALCAGVMLLDVIRVAGGVGSEYAPGLMLLFLGMPVLLPMTARQAALVVVVLSLGLAALPAFSAGEFGGRSYWLGLAFPVAAGIESIVATALLDRMRFSDFLRREEIRETRDELRKLDSAKTRFTANVHHELRTPLTLTLAPVEAMLAGDFGEISELQRGYLKTIQSNGLRLLKLINNLLDLAKIEGEQLTISRRPVQLHDLVDNIVSGARPLAERKGVLLDHEGFSALPVVHADSEAFEKILVNLLGNALKFTDAEGEIWVKGWEEAQGDAPGVHLVVTDTGEGLEADQLGRIFDRFAQVDGSNTRKHEGTGIGLSLVQELVKLHGGRIWAESEGLGHGAQMHVVLPVGESDEETRDAVAEALAEEAGQGESLQRALGGLGADLSTHDDDGEEFGEGLRLAEMQRHVERVEGTGSTAPAQAAPHRPDTPEVLVVEDNTDMRRLLAHLLGQEFRVRTASNGREGLEAVRDRLPHVVLTDVMMPEMSGTELCAAIKGEPELRDVPVVLVTSKAEREMKIEGLELGADDYVTKPFHPRELLARVRSLVELRLAQEALAAQNDLLTTTNFELEQTMEELKQAGAQLVHAERLSAVGELAAGVAHEINNPVNFAMNAARTLQLTLDEVREVAEQMAALGKAGPEHLADQVQQLEVLRERIHFDETADTLGELAGIVTDGLERTAGLVGDLRDFAAPGARERGSVDVVRGVRMTLRLVGHTFVSQGVEVTSDLPEGLPQVAGDARALNQVFLNLLKNAAEAFEGRSGSIWVEAGTEESEVVVEVRDNGPGIAPAMLERVFEPFHTSKGAAGSGLGLSICRRIAEEHGGSLELVSTEGEGTTARLRLPVVGAGRHAA